MRILRRAGSALLGAVLLAVIGLLIALVAVPLTLGWVPLTVLSGSMAPSIPTGSLIVVDPVTTAEEIAGLRTGDVITFMPHPDDSTLVTHRITGIAVDTAGQPRFTTRGDHNRADDAEAVTPEQVRGVVRYHVPWAGYVATLLEPEQKRVGVVVLVAALAGDALWHLVRAARHRRRPASPPVTDPGTRLRGEAGDT